MAPPEHVNQEKQLLALEGFAWLPLGRDHLEFAIAGDEWSAVNTHLPCSTDKFMVIECSMVNGSAHSMINDGRLSINV